jgi:hypothetical protein
MAEIHLKTVECLQLSFDHSFWANLPKIWPKNFQTGRISANLDEIRPKSV